MIIVPTENGNTSGPKIMVIGVGGGGCNAIKTLAVNNSSNIRLIAVNTDEQALKGCEGNITKIQIGPKTTVGLGCGADPGKGKMAFEESSDEIAAVLEGMDMVFITAGMGGGTGTGAAPEIARIAKNKGILTIGVVSKPFAFEGTNRMNAAEEGILLMKQCVDSIKILPNEKLFEVEPNHTLRAAFAESDKVLANAIAGTFSLITTPGNINLDFADICAILRNGGEAFIGIAEVDRGEKKVEELVRMATINPLVEHEINESSTGVLIFLVGDDVLSVADVNSIGSEIGSMVAANATIIFGSAPAESEDSPLRLTVITSQIKTDKASEETKTTSTMREKVAERAGSKPSNGDGTTANVDSDQIPSFLRVPGQ